MRELFTNNHNDMDQYNTDQPILRLRKRVKCHGNCNGGEWVKSWKILAYASV